MRVCSPSEWSSPASGRPQHSLTFTDGEDHYLARVEPDPYLEVGVRAVDPVMSAKGTIISYPQRVRGLVLIDPLFPRGFQGKQRLLFQLRWLVHAARASVRALNALGLRRSTIPTRDIRQLDEATREALRGAESFEDIARRYTSLRPVLGSLPTANYLGQLIATVAPLPPLTEIEVPVAVLLSGESTLADTDVSREEAARFPRSEVITLSANHWPLTEAPDETREEIEGWIARTFG